MDTAVDHPAAEDVSATRLLRARIAVSAVFFILGCGTFLWAVHIPIVTARLGIDYDVFGLALLTLAIGAVGTMPLTGIALGRLGSRKPTAVLAATFAILAPIPIVSPSVPFLFVALFLFGACMGALDVAMNVQAAEVEKARGQPTMSSLHGFYSVGGLIGAGVGGLIVGTGLGWGGGAIAAAIALLILALWSAGNLLHSKPHDADGPHFAIPPVAVLGLGAIVFLTFSAEGAVTDWSALYLSSVKMSGEGAAASGAALFSIAMVTCRLAGDWIVAKLGPTIIVAGGGALVTLGMVIAVASPWPLVSAVGFGIVGVGAANVVPVGISAATRKPGVRPNIGVAAVTSMGYAGFLIIPPVLGFVANAYGLSISLLLVAAMGVAIAALVGSVRQ